MASMVSENLGSPETGRQLLPDRFLIIPSFVCNVGCDHCQHRSSPHRRHRMPFVLFRRIAEQALEGNCSALYLSGGEPFLLRRYVKLAARLCSSSGTRLVVETNGSWGRNRERAQRNLAAVGRPMQLRFSVDEAHLRRIPTEHVLRAIDVAVRAGNIDLSVVVAYTAPEEIRLIEELITSRYPGIAVMGRPIVPLGRAARHPELCGHTAMQPWRLLQGRCEAQQAFFPAVHPDGQLHFCRRMVMILENKDPLILGNLALGRLDDLLSDVRNRLVMYILAFGGAGLGYLLDGSPHAALLQAPHADVCHFCYDVLSRKEVVDYLTRLLGSPVFDRRLAEGLRRARERQHEQWRESAGAAPYHGRQCDSVDRN